MPKKQDKTLEVVAEENSTLDAVDVRFANIPVTHELVSKTKTPKAYIKDKMGMEYVEIGYMKKQADLHYPGYDYVKTYFFTDEDPELSDFQRDEIVALAESISEEQKTQIESLIESGDINNLNYKGALAKLKRIA